MTGDDGGTRDLDFDHCIVAAGATTRLLPGTQLSQRVVTYEEQILSDTLPGSILIAGAGAIGIEFAYVLNATASTVTVVEFLDRVLPLEDEEVSAELAKRYKRAGITILTGTRVESIDDSGEKVSVVVSKDGAAADPAGRQGAAGHRLRATGRGLRAGEDRGRADRPRRDRDRRLHAHQRRRASTRSAT